jgi:integrase
MGSVTEIKTGKKPSFQAKVRMNGKSLSATFPTNDLAKKWITTTEADIHRGIDVSIHDWRKVKLSTIFEEYIKDGNNQANKNGSLKIISIEIGEWTLGELNTKKLGNYIAFKLKQQIPPQADKKKDSKLFKGGKINVNGEMVQRTYAPGTVRKFFYCISTALRWHAKINEYTFNSKPFDEIVAPKAWGNPRERVFSDDEVKKIIEACDMMYVNKEHLKDIIHFQLYSCMRIGETLQMKWKDIFIDETTPSSSYIFIPKENQKTKEKKSVFDRFVPMRPELYYLVKDRLLARRGKENDNDKVFPFWTASNVFYQRFRVICKNAKVTDCTTHDFRHTSISWLFANTLLSDIEIAKITGHIELKTLSLYTKLRPKNTGAKIWAGLSLLPK